MEAQTRSNSFSTIPADLLRRRMEVIAITGAPWRKKAVGAPAAPAPEDTAKHEELYGRVVNGLSSLQCT